MDKIEKALEKLSAKEKEIVRDVLSALEKDDPFGLDVQKLKGHKDIFRIRKKDIRIIYRKTAPGDIFILAIERRSEKTYRRF